MSKSIKKRYRIVIAIMAAVVILPLLLALLIQLPVVQTALVRQLTNQMGRRIDATISVGSIHFRFFNNLSVKDILLLDQNSDTLLYTKEARVRIRSIEQKGSQISLSKVTIREPVFKIIKDESDETNLRWYLSHLERERDQDDEKSPFSLLIDQISVTRGRVNIISPPDDQIREPGSIDFNDMSISDIDATLENFMVRNDTVSMSLYRASFTEKSGFRARRASFDLSICQDRLMFGDVEIETTTSLIKGERIAFNHHEENAFRNFDQDVSMDIVLRDTELSPYDLGYFVPEASDIESGRIMVTGNFRGPLTELRGRNIVLTGGEKSRIECDFDLSGLPDIDNSYIYINVKDLTTDLSELKLLGVVQEGVIPADIAEKTGPILFSGTFSGFTTDFVTYGRLSTGAGNLFTDMALKPTADNRYLFEGELGGDNIDLGILTGSKTIGKSSFNISIDGRTESFREFDASISGSIDTLLFNDYTYNNIVLNGEFTEKMWNGSVGISEENLSFDFTGLVNFESDTAEFDFSLDLPYANLYALNIDKADSNSAAGARIRASFTGTDISGMTGAIHLEELYLRRFDVPLTVERGLIRRFYEDNSPFIEIDTDFLRASVTGEANFGQIPTDLASVAASLIPSQFDKPEKERLPENKFVATIEFLDTDTINMFLQTGLTIAGGTIASVEYDPEEEILLSLVSDRVSFRNNSMESFALSARLDSDHSEATISSSELTVAGGPSIENIRASLMASTDSVATTMEWNNEDAETPTRGLLFFSTLFFREDTIRSASATLEESTIYVMGTPWNVGRTPFLYRRGEITVENLLAESGDNFYMINGTVSERAEDLLKIEISGIDLASLNRLVGEEEDDATDFEFEFGGTLSGRVVMSSILSDLMVETDNLIVEDFTMAGHDYGNIIISSLWDSRRGLASLNLHNEVDEIRNIMLQGTYSPSERDIELSLLTYAMPIDLLNPLLSSFASEVTGNVSGKIDITGSPDRPDLEGSLFLSEGSLKIDYLQTVYHIDDSIRFTSSSIVFDNVTASDVRGNPIGVSGSLNHSYFSDFTINLSIRPERAMVLNTTAMDNDQFYGRAFATGLVTIRGGGGDLSFDISARTDRNTMFHVPLASAQTIGDYPFIIFTSPDQTDVIIEERAVARRTGGSISLSMDLNVTPDAEVQIVIDPRTGDIIRGRGAGRLNIGIRPGEPLRMNGDYIISSGDYMFTVGNLFNKRFVVEDGSRISWSGDITEADIDIRAFHRVDASLHEILHDERFRERIPVECVLILSDNLTSPTIGFDIQLPTADEQTRSYLRNAINTEEELSIQFLYLLVMRQFYPDPTYMTGGAASTATSIIGTSAIGSSIDVIFNQFANMISQISSDFDVGFTYRPGNEISPDELELALSTQIFDDRIIINGHIDVAGNQHQAAATTFSGDVDIEFKITEKIRFNFFNRSNNHLLYETAPYTQGVGLLFKHDFDRIRLNLFRRERNRGTESSSEVVTGDTM